MKQLMVGLILLNLLACKTLGPVSSDAKVFGTDIPPQEKPYKVSLFRYSLSDEIKRQFELLSASAGSQHLRTLGFYKVKSFQEEGLVLAEEGTLAKDDIVSREGLHFVHQSDLLRVDNSPGFILSFLDAKKKRHPIAFMLQSTGEILHFCDSKPHHVQYELGPDSELEPIRFDCDINLKKDFELRINKGSAPLSGDVYPIVSPVQLDK